MTEVWVAPGPGSWMRDDVHFTGAMSGYLAAVFPSAFAEGWRQGMARYGLPLEAIEPAIVGGRMFARPKPLGAPDPKPGKTPSPPPKAVVRMLFAVQPELRRRKKAAKERFATHRWRADRADWRTQHAPVLRTRCLELQSIDPATLDDGEFRAHLARLEALFHDGKVLHFGQNPASAVPVGDLVAHVEEWTGAPPARVAAALQGHNPSSAQTLPFLDAIAAAIRDVPGLAADFDAHDGTAIDRLHLLRNASPEVTAALDAYRTEFGRRVVTGFDVTDETLDELPGLVVSSIGVRLHDHASEDQRDQGDVAAAALRAEVPPEHRATFDELLEEARAGYALHDEDVGLTYTWPLGLIRRALQVAGARLADRGALGSPDDVFEATPTEIAALLASDGDAAPSAAELAARAEERRRLSLLVAPDHLGPEASLPDPAMFPGAVARITRAFLASVSDANFAREAIGGSTTDAHGVPASPGVYEGTARVLHGTHEFERLQSGDVLVAPLTSPAYNAVLPLLGAVVTDKGGALCHAAIVAREFGIPAVVGTIDGTSRIPDGAKVRVDGTTGTVTVLG